MVKAALRVLDTDDDVVSILYAGLGLIQARLLLGGAVGGVAVKDCSVAIENAARAITNCYSGISAVTTLTTSS